MTHDCVARLIDVGFSRDDAETLRRISMTLHHWHELECGDSNDHVSRVLVRGYRDKETKAFVHDDNGTPWIETHYHRRLYPSPFHYPTADREAGALKRLKAILARYPGFNAYVQTDPRGASLYILRPDDMKKGDDVSSVYTRGIAVYK
jgi:hypothetical protein